ncbi:MAG: PEP-utilizing enzyme [Gammaproteobacteria bacterium]|nr:PEP-utilizing enzyme [Gammaproteobacteria bacterium]
MAVRFLQEVTKSDIEQVGGKAANLGELLAHGFPIPPGFVVGADIYRKLLSDIDTSTPSEAIRRRLVDDPLAITTSQEILRAHKRLQSNSNEPLMCAVRSSATAEDLGEASFAGQHATYYYVDERNLIEMVRKCWASLWSNAAVSYRQSQGIDHAGVMMAVLVQEMIPSDVSGVTFTANPVSGDTQEIVTDATWGMGAAIVDGRVSPDHFMVRRADFAIQQKRIANKKSMVSSRLPPDETRMAEVPFERRHVSCLSDEMLIEVSRWSVKAEQYFGAPQDVEWAIHENRYYMLQSRPITIMGEESFAPGEKRKLVLFKAAAENFTEPVLPLTQDSLPPGPHWIKGRLYNDLWPMHVLVPIKLTDEQAARLAYLEMPEDLDLSISWLKLPMVLATWFVIYLGFGLIAARSRAMPDDFMESFRAFTAEIEADDALSPRTTMVKLLNGAPPSAPCGHRVIWINIASVPRYFLPMGLLNALLKRWIPDIEKDAGSLLCSGTEGVLSLEMGRSIFELSRTAKTLPAVVRCMETQRPNALFNALKNDETAQPFLDELNAFLRVHGHRALKEFEIASERFEENPAPVLAMVKNHLAADADPGAMEARARARRADLFASIKHRLGHLPLERVVGWRWRLIDHLAGRARYFIKLRENSRFYHIMAWYSARKCILRAERELLGAGKLKVKDDIFYLRWPEVTALRAGQLEWADVEDRIRERRMEIIRWSKMTPPRTINIDLRVAPRRTTSNEDEITGQGASPGTYEGLARVILDPSIDADLKPGEILVAPYTDPAWTPLFLIARAAVVEVGSYLSHAGTIAREYGMPCVVDVADCTNFIKTGDRIFVDGTQGFIRLNSTRERAA